MKHVRTLTSKKYPGDVFIGYHTEGGKRQIDTGGFVCKVYRGVDEGMVEAIRRAISAENERRERSNDEPL